MLRKLPLAQFLLRQRQRRSDSLVHVEILIFCQSAAEQHVLFSLRELPIAFEQLLVLLVVTG